MKQDKRHHRETKRIVKRAGNKKIRAKFKENLTKNPEDAHLILPDYDGLVSKSLNGIDKDQTRLKPKTNKDLSD